MEDAKPFYKHGWRMAGLILAFITLVGLGLFVWRTVYFYKEIKNGKTFEQALTQDTAPKPLNPSQIKYLQSMKDYVSGKATDPFAGPSSSSHEVVVFIDYDCPYSKQMVPIMRDFMKAKPDIKVTVLDFPVADIHPEAMLPAIAARCVWNQAKPDIYWAFHDRLFSEQGKHTAVDLRSFAKELSVDIAAYDQCLSEAKTKKLVTNSETIGARAGVRGTPTFFVDGGKLEGVVSVEQITALLR
ncbi:MAG: DsbA family protein [Patescibacteria group bacterium]|jgi:protein-disulfide isomerase